MAKNRCFFVGDVVILCELRHSIENTTPAQIGGKQSSPPQRFNPCMCVVFRMDDIQDSFVNNAQLEAMNLFSLEVSHYH